MCMRASNKRFSLSNNQIYNSIHINHAWFIMENLYGKKKIDLLFLLPNMTKRVFTTHFVAYYNQVSSIILNVSLHVIHDLNTRYHHSHIKMHIS